GAVRCTAAAYAGVPAARGPVSSAPDSSAPDRAPQATRTAASTRSMPVTSSTSSVTWPPGILALSSMRHGRLVVAEHAVEGVGAVRLARGRGQSRPVGEPHRHHPAEVLPVPDRRAPVEQVHAVARRRQAPGNEPLGGAVTLVHQQDVHAEPRIRGRYAEPTAATARPTGQGISSVPECRRAGTGNGRRRTRRTPPGRKT